MTTVRLGACLVLLAPSLTSAQSLTIGAYGVVATHNEVAGTNRVDGFGGAVGGEFAVTSKISLEGFGYYASVTPAEDPLIPSYKVLEGQVHLRYAVTSVVHAELGYLRRTIDPALSAQELAGFSAGARIEYPLTSAADMFVRAAFVPVASFSGGGSSGLSYHIGLGISVGPSAARWRVKAEYDFQRFARSIGSNSVPIQSETARLGFELVVF